MSPTYAARISNINDGVKEMLSRQLATIEIAIINIQAAIDITIAAVDPADVTCMMLLGCTKLSKCCPAQI